MMMLITELENARVGDLEMETPLKIAIASGKGGTGKTTLATNLALILAKEGSRPVQLIDCDVEEPNAHLFLELELEKVQDVTLLVPKIDKNKCTYCGKCANFCEYNALAVLPKDALFFPELCHGCGGCTLVCPEAAITEGPRVIGIIERGVAAIAKPNLDPDLGTSDRKGLEFFHGLLNIGEPMATPIISTLKTKLEPDAIGILDAPPGTACPVIETISDSDFCILVTEPTPFGLWDLQLAVEVARTLELPFGVIINRDGIGDDRVEKYCNSENIPILLRVPQDRQIARLYSKGIPFVNELEGWAEKFQTLYTTIQESVNTLMS